MVMEIIVSVMLLLVGIAVLVVIHVCIVGRAFRGEDEEITVIQTSNYVKRMSNEDLQKLPCYDYKVEERESRETSAAVDCAVCLENFKMGERCRLLPNCRHSFHAQCIDSWLVKTPICPICRTCADVSKTGLVLKEETALQMELIEARL